MACSSMAFLKSSQFWARPALENATISAVGCSDRPEVLDESAPYNFGPLDIGYCDTKRGGEDSDVR